MKKTILLFFVLILSFSSTINVFADLKDISTVSSWAKDAVMSLEKRGILSADSSGNFNPKSPITRSELVKMLVLADDKINADDYGKYDYKIFTDVSVYNNSTRENYKYIMAAYFNDMVSGTTNNTFNPNSYLTREEFSAILHNILVPAESKKNTLPLVNTNKFKDKSKISAWAAVPVEVIISTGLMVGTATDTLSLKGLVTKEQAAVIVNKFISQKDMIINGIFNNYNPKTNEVTNYTLKGVKAVLYGERSIPGNNSRINNSWEFVSKPTGSNSVLNTADKLNPYFIPDKTGTYTVMQTAVGAKKTNKAEFTNIVKELNNSTDNVDLTAYENTRKHHISIYARGIIALTDGWFIAGDIHQNKIVIANAITGTIGKEYQLDFTPYNIKFDPVKNIIISCQGNRLNEKLPEKRIAKIDINTDKVSYINTSYRVKALTFGEDSLVFAFTEDIAYEWVKGTISSHIAIIDIDKETVISENGVAGIDSYSYFMAYDKNQDNLFLAVEGISSSSLARYYFDNKILSFEKTQYIWDAGQSAKDFVISADGKHIALVSGGGNEYESDGSNYLTYDIDSSDFSNIHFMYGSGAYPVTADYRKDNKYFVLSNRKTINFLTPTSNHPGVLKGSLKHNSHLIFYAETAYLKKIWKRLLTKINFHALTMMRRDSMVDKLFQVRYDTKRKYFYKEKT